MKKTVSSIVEEYAHEARNDFIPFHWPYLDSNNAADLDIDLKAMDKTLKLVRALLARGFQAVDLIEDGGCIAWPDQSPEAVLGRIRHEWEALGREPNLGDICWFNLPDELQDHPPAQV